MSSTLALFDMVAPLDFGMRRQPPRRRTWKCERCGGNIPLSENDWVNERKRFCCELCRRRAEHARWKAKKRAQRRNMKLKGEHQ